MTGGRRARAEWAEHLVTVWTNISELVMVGGVATTWGPRDTTLSAWGLHNLTVFLGPLSSWTAEGWSL